MPPIQGFLITFLVVNGIYHTIRFGQYLFTPYTHIPGTDLEWHELSYKVKFIIHLAFAVAFFYFANQLSYISFHIPSESPAVGISDWKDKTVEEADK